MLFFICMDCACEKHYQFTIKKKKPQKYKNQIKSYISEEPNTQHIHHTHNNHFDFYKVFRLLPKKKFRNICTKILQTFFLPPPTPQFYIVSHLLYQPHNILYIISYTYIYVPPISMYKSNIYLYLTKYILSFCIISADCICDRVER